jgi:hypothetical protein
MKRFPLRGALKRSIKKADVKQTSIVWIAANSLSKEYDGNEARGWQARHG